MTDGLARLAPVAKPLLEKVDVALATLGAPPTHPVWRLLGTVGVTPGALVASVAEFEPARLRAAADALRRRADAYGQRLGPAVTSWEGAAARRFATTAAALRDHADGPGPLTLAGRLRATASYVEGLADWQQSTRDGMARALAAVMASAEAVTLRTYPASHGEPGALTGVVGAAAQIGAVLLRAAQEAGSRARDVVRGAAHLEELAYRPPNHGEPAAPDGPIRLP